MKLIHTVVYFTRQKTKQIRSSLISSHIPWLSVVIHAGIAYGYWSRIHGVSGIIVQGYHDHWTRIIGPTLLVPRYWFWVICPGIFVLGYLSWVIYPGLFVLGYLSWVICPGLFIPGYLSQVINPGYCPGLFVPGYLSCVIDQDSQLIG